MTPNSFPLYLIPLLPLLGALVSLVNYRGTFPSPLVGQSPTSLPPPRAPRASWSRV
jgi:hypothetical protein